MIVRLKHGNNKSAVPQNITANVIMSWIFMPVPLVPLRRRLSITTRLVVNAVKRLYIMDQFDVNVLSL
ncbi:MAG TPA: hypothetical protein DCM28_15970 [Phycisphaerales bacterium]|nr:hypothetical protein [Phycisphaerales bacterium]HCD33503.1 hypothetical protein [Phycisphaerales bacterium]|tara:strand:- start:619 stop:822 length:204 start_codon:yes stop_codon:yes gene_type:complete